MRKIIVLFFYFFSIPIFVYPDGGCGVGFRPIPDEVEIFNLYYGGYLEAEKNILIPKFSSEYQLNEFLTIDRTHNYDLELIRKGEKFKILYSHIIFNNNIALGFQITLPNEIKIEFIDTNGGSYHSVGELRKRISEYFQFCQKI